MRHPVILPHVERAREVALRRALSQRARTLWRGLGRPLQAQLALGALGLPALVADHAQRYYTARGAGPDPRAALVPWIVRVVIGLTLGLGFLLARLGPRVFLRAEDEAFLTLTALTREARFRHRAAQLGLIALPMVWLGTGAVLPLAWNGDVGLLVRGLALWLAWASVAWATCAAVSALAPRQGRGQALWELALALVAPALLWGARILSGLVVPLERPDSLWVTAALGALLAFVIARTVERAPWLLARREAALERARAHDDRARGRAARLRGAARAGRPTLPRWARGALALVQRNALMAIRSPRVGGPWAGSVLLKVLGLALVLAPAAAREGRPWALAGAALLLADAVAGGALITQMEYELPHVFFGAPGPRSRRWWGAALPHLALSAACALALAAIAFAAPDGGPATARFILGWCGLAGASLVVMAANLAMAAYPETAVAQNLFWIGLLVCLILSSVLPLFGWVILFAFALVSFRQLRHWGPACLVALAFAAALALAPPVRAQTKPAAGGDTVHVARGPTRTLPAYVQVSRLDDSLVVLSAGTANVTACLTDSGWVLVDTGPRAEAPAIREEIRRLADRRFDYVVDTHVHDDHAGGNGLYIGMGVPVLATVRARDLARQYKYRVTRGAPKEIARLEACAAAAPPGAAGTRMRGFLDFMQQWWREAADDAARDPNAVVVPTATFRGRATHGTGPRRLVARELPAGHTAGDCAVFFPGMRVAVVGDVFAKGSVPFADQFMMGGSMEGILAAQDSLLAWIPDDTTGGGWTIVPGHGPVARRADLVENRRALGELRACLRQAYDRGRAPAVMGEDCLGAGFDVDRGDYAAWLFAEDWRRARAAVHKSMTKD